MKITIHRGTKEIGGTVIELQTATTRILLDAGAPLSQDSRHIDINSFDPDAVLVSHPHQDHYGLIHQLDDQVPVYIGKVAHELINAALIFRGKALHLQKFKYYQRKVPFVIGDLKITPYLNDHSSVDAYSFLIEAENRRILYTGDFRASGNKASLFDDLLVDMPSDLDLLLMEGTMLRRDNDEFPNEKVVREKIESVLATQNNISFFISSSQNIDRLVSATHACQNTGKKFVIDIYTAWVLEKIKPLSKKTPHMEWDEISIYADYRLNEIMKLAPEYFGDFKRRVYQHRVTKDQLEAEPAKFLYLKRMYQFKIMEYYKKFGTINLIYSQWLGYLDDKLGAQLGAKEISAFREAPDVNFTYAHTSGHATSDVLKTMAKKLNPKRLIPIHTEYPDDYKNHFQNVCQLKDGESFDLDTIQ